MLATRLPGILPPLTHDERLEVATIFSVANHQAQPSFYQRPFRNPHHSASAVALVGGGSRPRPGEISLAHHGVLFLDEAPEFQRQVLEVIREPMESGEIIIARANHRVCFPAQFQLVAAMNPCPCGYYGDLHRNCRCSTQQIRRYRDKISGPLLDRIDLQLCVTRLPSNALTQRCDASETSQQVRKRVVKARDRQILRSGKNNASLQNKELEKYCDLTPANQKMLEKAVNQFQLSPRAYHRILRVSRTIADLDEQKHIQTEHLHEALTFRALDRELK